MRQNSTSRLRGTGGWLLTASVVGGSLFVGVPMAQAAPAPEAGTSTFNSGFDQTVIVPDGVCAVNAVVAGAPGGTAISSGTEDNPEDPEDPGSFRGPNGSGATVSAHLPLGAGERIEVTVGSAGSNGGGAGQPGGGDGSVGGHRGAGGGGYSSISVGGELLILAAGGGGTGGGHTPDGGHGGDAGVANGVAIDGGTVFAGGDGTNGFDLGWNADPATFPTGGLGGGVTAGGAGGTNPRSQLDPAQPGFNWDGFAGSSLQGGDGGADNGLDGGAGGGAGYFGGGGGASTDGEVGTSGQYFVGGGGGGGSTYVSDSTLLSGVSLTKNRIPAGEDNAGDTLPGFVTFEWVMCQYDLAVTKSVIGDTIFEDGDTVRYEVTVTNVGPDAMALGDTVTLVDDLAVGGTLVSVDGLGASTPAVGETIGAAGIDLFDNVDVSDDPQAPDLQPRGLAVGDSVTVVYDATASGTETLTNTVTAADRFEGDDNDTASAVVQPAQPSLHLVKSVTPDELTADDREATYTFAVTNDGDIDLHDVVVTDPGPVGGTGQMSAIDCGDDTDLAVGETISCTAVYTAGLDDLNGEPLENQATAAALTPAGNTVVSDPAQAELPTVLPEPSIELEKTADAETASYVDQTVTFLFTVTNTGNVNVADVEVSEGDFSGKGQLGDVVCPAEAELLAPAESVTCEAEYRVVAADLTGEPITNTATASATGPFGVVLSEEAEAALKSSVPPALAVTGGVIASGVLAGGVLLVAIGFGIFLIARRRSEA